METDLTLCERAGQPTTANREQTVLGVQYAVPSLLRWQQIDDRSGLGQHAVPIGGKRAGIRRRSLEFELRATSTAE